VAKRNDDTLGLMSGAAQVCSGVIDGFEVDADTEGLAGRKS
jgi:hypothetical protein